MSDFLCQHFRFNYTSTLSKTRLVERDQVRQNRAQSCTQQFGDDFAYEGSPTNRPKLLQFVRIIHVGYNHYTRMRKIHGDIMATEKS